MPKHVGTNIAAKTVLEVPENYVRLTAAQVRLLIEGREPSDPVREAMELIRVLDTSDKGSAGTLAKRWWMYFAPRSVIRGSRSATKCMLARAEKD